VTRARRGRGESSVYRRKDKRWCAVISSGWREDGRRARTYLYGKTKQDVLDALRKASPNSGKGNASVLDITQHWLHHVAKARVKASTFRLYGGWLRVHIEPKIGDMPISSLKPNVVQKLLADMESAGKSPRLREQVFTLLDRVLRHAVRAEMIDSNPMANLTRPRPRRSQLQTYDRAQVSVLLKALKGDRLHPLYVLAVSTGMRRGELLGLQWQDIDLKAGTASIRRSVGLVGGTIHVDDVKGGKGRRVWLSVPAIKALRAMKKSGTWLFPTKSGAPISPSNLVRHFRALQVDHELPRIRFHDLRHTAATLLLEAGVHPKVVADMLGHSSVTMTLDTYSHVSEGMHQAAALAMNAIMKPVRKRSKKTEVGGQVSTHGAEPRK
jgi:integrase